MTESDTWVRRFADAVMAQHECTRSGDARAGNRHARAYRRAFDRIRAEGDAGRERLRALLSDERKPVRLMAAAYLLRYAHVEASAVLEALAAGDGFVAFAAGESLARWRDGTWQLDPP